jgi:hypothetical protein
MDRKRTCQYCKSWAPAPPNREEADIGECRRRSPVTQFEVTHGYRPWSNVHKTDWCREFDNFHGDE